MPKKSGVLLPRRLDPIDFLATYLRSKPVPIAMIAAPFSIEMEGQGHAKLSRELVEELTKESICYKNFWTAASNLAKVTEAEAGGTRIAPILKEKYQDEYIAARDACINLDVGYVEQPAGKAH